MRAVKYGIRLDKDRLPYLVKEMSHNYKGRNACSPDRIVEILREIEEADSLCQEKFWMFCLDKGMKIIGYFELFVGSKDRCLVDRAHLYTCALSAGASSIIIAHNHPSGDPSPSKEDILLTECIAKGAALIGIALQDHLVLGYRCYASLRESNPDSFRQEGQTAQ